VGANGIEGGNVCQSQGTQRILDNLDTCRVLRIRGGGVVYCLDDLVDVRGNNWVWQLKKVQLQGRCHYGNFIFLQGFSGNRLAIIERISQVMSRGKGYVNKPNGSSSFISVKVRIVYKN
jgi:hypothetical protein